MKIAFIAGEASGDAIAADTLRALKALNPDIRFVGLGGPKMQAEGLDSWYDFSLLSVMGFVEVLKHLPGLLKLRRDMKQRLIAEQPDIVIGVDAPDFNLGLEKYCKQAGLRTLHLVSPSVWAWREKRAAKIAESVDEILCLFPMEPAIYKKYGMPARFIGHPMADRIALHPDTGAARTALAIGDGPLLAVLPGSRRSEIQRLLPDFLGAAQRLQQQIPQLQLVIPTVNAACRKIIEDGLASSGLTQVHVLDGQAQTAMIASDAVMLASGTAALEAMLCKKPMVVAYKISPITYRVVNALGLLKVSRFSLPNILSGQDLVPELIQDRCTPEAIAEALLPLITDPSAAAAVRGQFEQQHLNLRRDAGEQSARAILEHLQRA